ncbi:uncharacterized protein LOC144250845 isoform X2 [Urocitellus parryii]
MLGALGFQEWGIKEIVSRHQKLKRQGGTLPTAFRGRMALLTPSFGDSGLQNGEIAVNYCNIWHSRQDPAPKGLPMLEKVKATET